MKPAKIEPVLMIGDNQQNIVQVGRMAGGKVVLATKYPTIAFAPAEAKGLAQLLIKAAERIERGDVPLNGRGSAG